MALREIPGVRRGATLFTCNDGFYYQYISISRVKTHYRCYLNTCRARIWVEHRSKNITNNENFPCHNHSPDPLLEAKHVLREAIFQRAERESTQLKRIFDEECNKVSSEVAQSLAFGTIESSMRKCRKLNFPRLPTSAIDFADMLKAEEWARFSETLDGKKFFIDNIVVGGWSNLVFVSENTKHLLSTAEELFFDGTFKTVPSVPGLAQLFIVNAVAFDHAFPVAYVLMERRSYACYKAALQLVKQFAPDISPRLMSDFEAGLIRALRETFPLSDISGCWWHFSNCILKRVKKYRLVIAAKNDENVKKVIHMCMCLPLLPAGQIEAGLTAIGQHAIQTITDADYKQKLITITEYIAAQWIGSE
ncbi:uncharacterized protein LOC120355276 isoform X1 [Nilaparvata lugens]|uniref:uncharacterized protein LOC120355276 isoform X1 n=1 Tax=Nilaparvata lugens TaxID=108931 RepID=UPI00193D1003|nr:uncharacterized protein LOC120355276 isoform X1 [Nilaparvata lugens]